MRYQFSIIILVLALSTFVAAAIDEEIPNLQQPQYMVFTAGQPTEMGFDQLQTMGVKTVVNVLPEKECLKGEEVMVTSNQMEYHSLPFDPNGLNMNTIQKFAVLMNRLERPVLIHCSTGNHVGGLWFAYRVLVTKASLPVALKEARRIGMQPGMEEVVFNWVVQQKAQLS